VVVVIAVIAGIFIAGSLLLMLGARQRHISESGG
jgi:hypothetical protein